MKRQGKSEHVSARVIRLTGNRGRPKIYCLSSHLHQYGILIRSEGTYHRLDGLARQGVYGVQGRI